MSIRGRIFDGSGRRCGGWVLTKETGYDIIQRRSVRLFSSVASPRRNSDNLKKYVAVRYYLRTHMNEEDYVRQVYKNQDVLIYIYDSSDGVCKRDCGLGLGGI